MGPRRRGADEVREFVAAWTGAIAHGMQARSDPRSCV